MRALGERWCVIGQHRVTLDACLSAEGILRANYQDCLTRRHLQAQQRRDADAEGGIDDGVLDAEEDDGIETAAGDEFDDVFGDGSDLMDIDLPTDSALDAREAKLLQDLNEKLAAVQYEACNNCWEEGFDLHVVDGSCSSCRNDKGEPVKKWSAANRVHPCQFE